MNCCYSRYKPGTADILGMKGQLLVWVEVRLQGTVGTVASLGIGETAGYYWDCCQSRYR